MINDPAQKAEASEVYYLVHFYVSVQLEGALKNSRAILKTVLSSRGYHGTTF
jgi:hypothetical protein